MSAFLLSPDDDDDDIIITLLLLGACDSLVNRLPSFRESSTVEKDRRKRGKIRCKAPQHKFKSKRDHKKKPEKDMVKKIPKFINVNTTDNG